MSEINQQRRQQIDLIARAIDLSDAEHISRFGATSHLSVHSNDQIDQVLASVPLGKLSGHVNNIACEIKNADPALLKNAQGFVARLLGKNIESVVAYRAAKKKVTFLLADCDGLVEQMVTGVRLVTAIIADNNIELDFLQVHIEAGRQFLKENPDAGMTKLTDLALDTPRERFARRISNLALAASARELAVKQLELTLSNYLMLLDRNREIATTLAPLWFQHCRETEKALTGDSVALADAASAHNKLVAELTKHR